MDEQKKEINIPEILYRSGSTPAGSKKSHRRKKKQFKQRLIAYLMWIISAAIVCLLIIALISGMKNLFGGSAAKTVEGWPEYVKEGYLTINPNSRPGIGLDQAKSIVIHDASERGMIADDLRSSYEVLRDNKGEQHSSHLVIGTKGETILCIPIDEIAYASDYRDTDSISITYCWDSDDGSPAEETYEHLVDVTAWLCITQNIPLSEVIRHSEVTGISCPEYYAVGEENWNTFLTDVRLRMAERRREAAESVTSAEQVDSSEEESNGDSGS